MCSSSFIQQSGVMWDMIDKRGHCSGVNPVHFISPPACKPFLLVRHQACTCSHGYDYELRAASAGISGYPYGASHLWNGGESSLHPPWPPHQTRGLTHQFTLVVGRSKLSHMLVRARNSHQYFLLSCFWSHRTHACHVCCTRGRESQCICV